jgi:MFS family permease
MVLWGIGMGAQDSLLKAVLAGVVPIEKRSTAFGVFDTGFGVAWFLGSAAITGHPTKFLIRLAP